MEPIFNHLQDFLYPEYQWIATDIFHHHRDDDEAILYIVNRILETEVDDEPITNVYQSAIGAVCMQYKHRVDLSVFLTIAELRYASTRNGVIGWNPIELESITVRKILEILDPTFRQKSTGNNSAPAP